MTQTTISIFPVEKISMVSAPIGSPTFAFDRFGGQTVNIGWVIPIAKLSKGSAECTPTFLVEKIPVEIIAFRTASESFTARYAPAWGTETNNMGTINHPIVWFYDLKEYQNWYNNMLERFGSKSIVMYF
jgi:hypothetical protein